MLGMFEFDSIINIGVQIESRISGCRGLGRKCPIYGALLYIYRITSNTVELLKMGLLSDLVFGCTGERFVRKNNCC